MKRFRETFAALANVLALLVFGAWLVVQYLGGTDLPGHPDLSMNLMMAMLGLNAVEGFAQPKPETSQHQDLSPAASGIAVVVAVGLAIMVAFVWYDAVGFALGAVVLTAFVAARVRAFAKEHADEIGEARFTSHSSAS